MDINELKKRNHYVQKEYLRAWADNYGKVFQLLKPSKIVNVGINNTLVSSFFYKFFPINEQEKEFLLSFLPKNFTDNFFSKSTITSIDDVLDVMNSLPERIKTCDNIYLYSIDLMIWIASVLDSIDMWPKNVKETDQYKSMIEFIETQTIEEYICGIEESGIPVIKKIISNQNLLSSDEYEELIRYVALSYTRTKEIADSILGQKYKPVRIERIRPMLQYIIGIVLGQSLLNNKSDVSILNNKTSLRYITGGQPAVNLCFEKGQEVKDFQMYFPLCPYKAIKINMEGKGLVNNEDVTEDGHIMNLNDKISENSNYLIGYDSSDLIRYTV